ncbi:hypothetical protein ACQEU8_22145 [Streptomyces sp. CA-250714]|uniref:hypothetical protein n=1 Tax=Streptomyces sp. CA-250714 TaxID=3240060 RepID=UPI003D8CCCB9
MFLELLQALGTFFGGLGALIAATTQLLTFLQKKDEERGIGHGGDGPVSWMIPIKPFAYLAAAA